MSTTAADLPASVALLASGQRWLTGELRSDHAGEAGAVMIYRGILAGSRNPDIRRFASAHGLTEQGHLDLLETLLPARQRSALFPVWRIAGWLTGFLPALAGPRAVYATIDAVETFVDHHYQAQIDRLPHTGAGGALRAALAACQADEVHHRDEARSWMDKPPGPILALWTRMVSAGSKAAVAAARRF